MHNILKAIIEKKQEEIELHKSMFPIAHLLDPVFLNRVSVSMKDSIINSDHGIIAEFKRKSPSKGWIQKGAQLNHVVDLYTQANVAGISILTDQPFFGGHLNDLKEARVSTAKPLLRKDFIIDEYQILQAKAFGADCVLLIAAALPTKRVIELTHFAHEYGLEVLLEIHEESELDSLVAQPDIIGVNNRNLSTFETSIDRSFELIELIPKDQIVISESGIGSVDDMQKLRQVGFNGFLIGESFMREEDPDLKLSAFTGQNC